LNLALQKQIQDKNTPLGQILVGMGLPLKKSSDVCCPKIWNSGFNLREFHIDPEAVQKVPVALAGKHRAMPLYSLSPDGGCDENPLARESLQDLQFSLQLEIELSWRQQGIEEVIERFYGAGAIAHRTFFTFRWRIQYRS